MFLNILSSALPLLTFAPFCIPNNWLLPNSSDYNTHEDPHAGSSSMQSVINLKHPNSSQHREVAKSVFAEYLNVPCELAQAWSSLKTQMMTRKQEVSKHAPTWNATRTWLMVTHGTRGLGVTIYQYGREAGPKVLASNENQTHYTTLSHTPGHGIFATKFLAGIS